MTYCDGQSYVGDWAEGVRNGFGTCASPDGTTFEGHFKQNVKHGAGTLRRGDAGAVSQLWEDGTLVRTNVVTGEDE